MTRFRVPLLISALLAAALAAGTDRARAADVLEPVGEAVKLPVGRSADRMKDYVLIGATPVRFEARGAGRLYGYARLRYDEDDYAEHEGSLVFTGLDEPRTETMVFTPDPDYRFGVDVPGRAGAAVKFEFRLPKGKHRFGIASGAGEVLLLLYWDPDVEPERPAEPWKLSADFGLETIYDDNFLRYSDDYLDDFHAGTYPYKFAIDRQDTHILAPSFQLQAERKLIDWGKTRFRGRYKRWQYIQGDVKTNEGFWVYARQWFPGGSSLELSYNYAPEQYIRELSDRTALQPPSDPLEWKQFRYTRNVINATYRRSISKSFNGKLQLERNLRYYNRPFMENDIFSWEVRGTLYWRAHREWLVTLDYSYEYAPARGYDEVGETRETSDDSDPSYDRDYYQVDVSWRPRWARPWFESLSLTAQHMIYWFTSEKRLEDDPYHVGRKDRVYMVQLELDRELTRDVDMKIGVRYTERTVDSPWTGDIAEDKDFNQRRYWIGLTYKL